MTSVSAQVVLRVLALMYAGARLPDHDLVTSAEGTARQAVARPWTVTLAAVLAYLFGLAMLAAAAVGTGAGVRSSQLAPALVLLPPSIVLGLLVTWRRPDSPIGPGLAWLVTAPCLVWAVEDWGAAYQQGDRLPGGQLASWAASGVWVYQLGGFVILCLVFPDGRLAGRPWRALPGAFVLVAVVVNLLVSTSVAGTGNDEQVVVRGAIVAALVVLLAVLGGSVASIVVRYRGGDETVRAQLRWLLLGAGSVPALLAAGWFAQAAGASTGFAYSGFLLAMLLVLPGAVAIAILRHDLLDIDRLLSDSLSWLITSIASAAVFGLLVFGVTPLDEHRLADRSEIALAAFAAALVLVPIHQRVHAGVGRLVDAERTAIRSALHAFVRRVRDGEAEPEQVQDVLRAVLADPHLTVLLQQPQPGGGAFVDLAGKPVDDVEATGAIPLSARESSVGAIVPGRQTARHLRRIREAALEVRLPIEVSRLRLELRHALDDARTSRSRLVEAVTDERRRLERDLHDGAQQRIIAVGMRLRSVQRRQPVDGEAHADLDAAVAALESIVAELRRLAHGLRPSRLDDGLDVAIRDLVSTSPIPVTVRIDDLDVSETVAATAYFVIAECLTNTLKHADASIAHVSVRQPKAERLLVRISDDGCGGATSGFGMTALRDRVGALGGKLAITSPPGAGTVVLAEL